MLSGKVINKKAISNDGFFVFNSAINETVLSNLPFISVFLRFNGSCPATAAVVSAGLFYFADLSWPKKHPIRSHGRPACQSFSRRH